MNRLAWIGNVGAAILILLRAMAYLPEKISLRIVDDGDPVKSFAPDLVKKLLNNTDVLILNEEEILRVARTGNYRYSASKIMSAYGIGELLLKATPLMLCALGRIVRDTHLAIARRVDRFLTNPDKDGDFHLRVWQVSKQEPQTWQVSQGQTFCRVHG